jgi:hypothetical protein
MGSLLPSLENWINLDNISCAAESNEVDDDVRFDG